MGQISSEYKGKKQFKDMDTGQVFEVDYIKKINERSFKGGWRRVFLGDFLEILLEVGNSKIKVLEFVLNNVDTNNKLCKSIRQVSQEAKISYKTTYDAFKIFTEKGLLKKIGTTWVVMPDFIATFGSNEKNARLLTEYTEYDPSLFDNVE